VSGKGTHHRRIPLQGTPEYEAYRQKCKEAQLKWYANTAPEQRRARMAPAIVAAAQKLRGRKYSKERKQILQLGLHNRYKAIEDTYRNSIQYKAFREHCLRRDNYACQGPGPHTDRLDVHHIKCWDDYPELRFTPSNGLTLCRRCHLAEENRLRQRKGIATNG
jgi:HNH endonuclease